MKALKGYRRCDVFAAVGSVLFGVWFAFDGLWQLIIAVA